MQAAHKKDSFALVIATTLSSSKGSVERNDLRHVKKTLETFFRMQDCAVEVQQSHRGMTNRGHCLVNLKQLFSEVSNNLKKVKANVSSDPVAKV